MKINKFFLLTLALVIGIGVSAVPAIYAATIKMRVVVVNPSDKKEQTKSVRTELPKEIKQKDILESAGLDIEYDAEKGVFYAFKNDVVLGPLETKVFEIMMNDVWIVPAEQLEGWKKQTETLVGRLKDTEYFTQAELIAKTIYGRLDEIKTTQEDTNVSRQQHIAYYRDNLKTIETIKADLDKLQKILVAVGGPPNLDMIEKSDVNLKSPNSKTTWIIIFAVILFVAILSGTFYFTWLRQTSVAENIFQKEKDASFADFKPKKE